MPDSTASPDLTVPPSAPLHALPGHRSSLGRLGRVARLGRLGLLALGLNGCVTGDDPDPTGTTTAALVGTKTGACTVAGFGFDIDVPRVWVRGDIRINGVAPLADPGQRGIVELRSDTLGVVELGSTHHGSYDRWIVPGVYDLVYRHVAGDVVPANAETVIAHDVALTATTVFDIDITSVPLLGAITVDGAPPPDGVYEQGVIRLRDLETDAEFTVGRTLDDDLGAAVIPGTYDVVWRRNLGGTIVPVNTDAILLEDVVIAGPTELDVDVPTVQRTGAFRINGAAPPAGMYENAEILLRDPATGELVSLGQTRDQTYSRRVVPGTYDVIYARLLGSTSVPRNELAVVATGVELTADGDLDINIPMVTLRGSFALDGAPFPQGAYDRARFWLQGADPADTFELGTSEADYEIKVIPGTYDVIYQKLLSTGLVPENPWATVSTGVTITKLKGNARPTVLDIEVSSGWLATDVTVWGEAPPLGAYDNGQLRGQLGGDDPLVIGTTHDAGGSVRAVAGDYQLRYHHLIGDAVPANGDAPVGASATHAVAAPVAVDLHPGTLLGDFTQGGAAFPVVVDDNATISLRDAATGDVIVLGETRDQSYQRYMLGGTYDVIYDHEAGGDVVANRGARLGCVTFNPLPPLGVGVGGGGLAQP